MIADKANRNIEGFDAEHVLLWRDGAKWFKEEIKLHGSAAIVKLPRPHVNPNQPRPGARSVWSHQVKESALQ